MKIIQNDIV